MLSSRILGDVLSVSYQGMLMPVAVDKLRGVYDMAIERQGTYPQSRSDGKTTNQIQQKARTIAHLLQERTLRCDIP
jgi:hypothetical protein